MDGGLLLPPFELAVVEEAQSGSCVGDERGSLVLGDGESLGGAGFVNMTNLPGNVTRYGSLEDIAASAQAATG